MFVFPSSNWDFQCSCCCPCRSNLALIGGSIRQPAAFCGVVGLKPTYGLVSRYGLVAYASSLDVVGPMTQTVEDAARLLSVIAGHDARDSTSAAVDTIDFAAALPADAHLDSKPLGGVRVGILRQTLGQGVATEVCEAVQQAALQLEGLGASVRDVQLPSFDAGLPAYYVIALSEASSNLSRYVVDLCMCGCVYLFFTMSFSYKFSLNITKMTV